MGCGTVALGRYEIGRNLVARTDVMLRRLTILAWSAGFSAPSMLSASRNGERSAASSISDEAFHAECMCCMNLIQGCTNQTDRNIAQMMSNRQSFALEERVNGLQHLIQR